MTGAQVKQVYQWLDIMPAKGHKPSTETPLVEALVTHILKEQATVAVVKQALLARHATADLPDDLIKDTTMFDDEMHEVVEGGEWDDHDEDVLEQYKMLAQRRAKHAREEADRLRACNAM